MEAAFTQCRLELANKSHSPETNLDRTLHRQLKPRCMSGKSDLYCIHQQLHSEVIKNSAFFLHIHKTKLMERTDRSNNTDWSKPVRYTHVLKVGGACKVLSHGNCEVQIEDSMPPPVGHVHYFSWSLYSTRHVYEYV